MGSLGAVPVLVVAVLASSLGTTPRAARGQDAERVSWEDPRWRIEAAESRLETHEGREALLLRNGTAWLNDLPLRDGVVAFDLSAPPELGFHGIAFRAADDESYEHFYVRPFLSGNPDATQYTPVFHGVSGWQIYAGPRYALPARVPADRWVRVELRVRGARAEVSLDGGEPLVFPELVRPPVPGALGLTASGAPARFANLVVRPDAEVTFEGDDGAAAEEAPPGAVRRWRVSTSFAEERPGRTDPLDAGAWEDLMWDVLDTDVRGFANLARLRRRTEEANTVFAAVTLRVPRDVTIPVRFGFSDRVRVYLDGRPLYAGSDGWRSRDYRFLGTVGWFDEVVLPLSAGDHELWLAVSEDFGGWAAGLDLPEEARAAGVEVVEPR